MLLECPQIPRELTSGAGALPPTRVTIETATSLVVGGTDIEREAPPARTSPWKSFWPPAGYQEVYPLEETLDDRLVIRATRE